jgi:hypothetical protein
VRGEEGVCRGGFMLGMTLLLEIHSNPPSLAI